jgi:hypothetical protein
MFFVLGQASAHSSSPRTKFKYSLDGIFSRGHIEYERMGEKMHTDFEIFVTEEFEDWYGGLNHNDADRVAYIVNILEQKGVSLGFPYSSEIKNARYAIRELRVQSMGKPIRVLYAFDPIRNALLILGGDKGGDDRWYDTHVPIAERLWEQYLKELEEEQRDD